MDWKNVNLNSDYEKNKNLLENYTFEQLITEAIVNIKNTNVNKETVRQQAMLSIQSKFNEAMDILDWNIDNITNYVKDYNNIP